MFIYYVDYMCKFIEIICGSYCEKKEFIIYMNRFTDIPVLVPLKKNYKMCNCSRQNRLLRDNS